MFEQYHACPEHTCGRLRVQLLRIDICLLCDAPGGAVSNLCDACARELPAIADPCATCGAHAVPRTGLCRACSARPPPVDRTVCAVAYAPPVDYLVRRLKFHRDLRVVPVLAGLLVRAVIGETGIHLLAPVPMTPARLRSRGFNQALEIARVLRTSTGVGLTRAVTRRRGTDTSQSSLPDTIARRANVAGAFEVRAPIGGHVVIVDDVVTTAATVNAFARCLKGAGASRVDVWAVARTP